MRKDFAAGFGATFEQSTNYSRKYLIYTFPNWYAKDNQRLLQRELERAFILVDMQTGFIRNIGPKKWKRMIAAQRQVLDYCSINEIPVIVLEFYGHGTTIPELSEKFKDLSNICVIDDKTDSDGFRGTCLDSVLKTKGAKETYYLGINESFCVKDTAQTALKLGYKIATANCLVANSREFSRGNESAWFKKNGIYLKA